MTPLATPVIPKVEHGTCVACGITNGHGWRCISYYMDLAVRGHSDAMKEVQLLLSRHITGMKITETEAVVLLNRLQFEFDKIKGIAP